MRASVFIPFTRTLQTAVPKILTWLMLQHFDIILFVIVGFCTGEDDEKVVGLLV